MVRRQIHGSRYCYLRPFIAMAFALCIGLIPLSARGATFCVNDAVTLIDTLLRAQSNGEDDVIQLVQGVYFGNFAYTSSDPHALILEGGYTENCGTRVVSPANTVIDGIARQRVLFMESSQAAFMAVDGLTLRNGATDGDGGGLFASTTGVFILNQTTIEGNAASASGRDGGGVRITANTVTMTANTFRNNTVADVGGGLYVDAFTATLTDNTIQGNTANGNGGGAFITATTALLTNNTVTENTSNGLGGGIRFSRCSAVTLDGNTVSRNSANDNGGGLHIDLVAQVTLEDNLINLNKSDSHGGGAYVDTSGSGTSGNGGQITVSSNIVNGNFANVDGGGFYFLDASSATLTNNLVYSNTANGVGGGVLSFRIVDFILTNNTITDNSGAAGGGTWVHLSRDNYSASLYNNILWNNTASQGADLALINDGDENSTASPGIHLSRDNLLLSLA